MRDVRGVPRRERGSEGERRDSNLLTTFHARSCHVLPPELSIESSRYNDPWDKASAGVVAIGRPGVAGPDWTWQRLSVVFLGARFGGAADQCACAERGLR